MVVFREKTLMQAKSLSKNIKGSHFEWILQIKFSHETSRLSVFAHGCYVTSMSVEGNRMVLNHSLTHSLTHSLDSD